MKDILWNRKETSSYLLYKAEFVTVDKYTGGKKIKEQVKKTQIN